MADKRIIKAAYFASVKHREQRRKDIEKTPYINHPLALANVLAVECGVDDVEVICVISRLHHLQIGRLNANKIILTGQLE